MTHYLRIALEGNIGVGKTLLTEKLARSLHAQLILEQFTANPFLERFYAHPQKYALQVELGFLLDRYRQLNGSPAVNTGLVTIADYTFAKSRVFAGINLPPDEMAIYLPLYEILARDILKPEIILYLYNHTTGLQKNILKRGRPYELGIHDEYLEKIESAYLRYLESLESIPVLFFDVSHSDLHSRQVFSRIMECLKKKWEPGINFVDLKSDSSSQK